MANPKGINQYTRDGAMKKVEKLSKRLDERNAQIKEITKLSPKTVAAIRAKTAKMAEARRKVH